jgi:hypothetical protein
MRSVQNWTYATLAALFLAAAGAPSASSQQNTTYSPTTSATLTSSTFAEKMTAALERRHLLPMLDSATRGMTFEEGRRFGASLSSRGIARLSPDMSLKWATLIGTALDRADPAVCSVWTKGSSSPAAQSSVVMSLLGTLDEQELDAWMDVSAEAMEAELRQRPTIAVHPDSAALEVVSGIYAELGSENGPRFLSDLQNLNMIDQAETCWVGRTMRAYATGAPEEFKAHRAQLLARMIASGQ